jgi:hypothetical protein
MAVSQVWSEAETRRFDSGAKIFRVINIPQRPL